MYTSLIPEEVREGGEGGGVLHGGLNWQQATRSCEKCTTFLDIREYYQ